MKKRAFTLIELLVVIAIIAILAAILFPVFAKARERAMQTTCLNNEKQLGTAFQMYVSDTDGKLPYWYLPVTPPPGFANYTWDVAIYPYVKTKAAFTCPSTKGTRGTETNPTRTYSFPQNINGMPISFAKAPTKTVLLVEKGIYPVGTGADAPAEFYGQTTGQSVNQIAATWNNPDAARIGWHTQFPHNNGKNFLFLDGHAAWYRGILNHDDNNPFGYDFGPWPGGGQGPRNSTAWFGYCGPLDGFHTGDQTNGQPSQYGSNLPT